jgi:hypothetical protein
MTSDEIRRQLKQFDSVNPWKSKISKTKAILDKNYQPMLISELETYVKSVREDWADFFDMTVDELQSLFVSEAFDCDDFAGIMVGDIIKHIRRKGNYQAAVPIFRVIIEGYAGPHAIVMAFTATEIYFIEPQNGTLCSKNERSYKVLAVT